MHAFSDSGCAYRVNDVHREGLSIGPSLALLGGRRIEINPRERPERGSRIHSSFCGQDGAEHIQLLHSLERQGEPIIIQRGSYPLPSLPPSRRGSLAVSEDIQVPRCLSEQRSRQNSISCRIKQTITPKFIIGSSRRNSARCSVSKTFSDENYSETVEKEGYFSHLQELSGHRAESLSGSFVSGREGRSSQGYSSDSFCSEARSELEEVVVTTEF